MDILAFIKRVPDTSEADAIKIDASGKSIEKPGLTFKINNWDEYVLETAAQLKEKTGGTFTAVTVGNKDWDDVLRRALAMGADKAIRIYDDVSSIEPYTVAVILKAFIKQQHFDLILFGAQSEDFGSGQLGAMVAEMIDIPHATLVTGLEVEEKRVRINRELEAGTLESYVIELPALLTIQTGINQPRYISLGGIRRAMKMEIQAISLNDLDLSLETITPKVKLGKLELPPKGKKAELISGLPGESAEKLAKILQSAGVF
ncbi:MAG: electron transfer flavoprotein subunit beta/FixA family protein [Dehalococcoidales bacterium]|nr:electron transfer flavoprotein subunit beta/FixA family protein [Dehalococcoidales bacterium]